MPAVGLDPDRSCSGVQSSANWNACAVQPSGTANLAIRRPQISWDDRDLGENTSPVSTGPLL
jgi:hypothetical protein